MTNLNNFYNEFNDGMEGGVPQLTFGEQSAPTNPMVPNQLAELGMRLNEGVKNVEVGAIDPKVFETIPVQHFKELGRLAKLADSKISVHAPIVDPAGFTERGWDEESRESTEFYLKSVLDRAHKIDPDGNVVVNMHSTGMGIPPAQTWKKGLPDDKQMMMAVNVETGEFAPLKYEKLNYLGGEQIFTPESRLNVLNQTKWEDEKLSLMSIEKSKEETNLMKLNLMANPRYQQLSYMVQNDVPMTNEEKSEFGSVNQKIQMFDSHIAEQDRHVTLALQSMHHKYKNYYKPETEREKFDYAKNEKMLKSLNDKMKIQENIQIEASNRAYDRINKLFSNDMTSKQTIFQEETEWMENKIQSKLGGRINSQYLLSHLQQLPAPEVYRSVDEFAKEKTTKTLSNVAMHAYEKYGPNSPVVAVENWTPNSALSRGENMAGLIKGSREEFAQRLVEDKGMSQSKAEQVAEKLLGATWDVGHIYELRKSGFTKEDIIKDTEKIAPYVKHVHLTDNFGYSDSHLAPGMGDVPIKEMLEKIKKEDKDRAYVVEAGGFVSGFGQSPLPHTLEAMNSPIYSLNKGPQWSQVRDFYSSYMPGYDAMFADQNYSGGFSGLPLELGAQRGKQE